MAFFEFNIAVSGLFAAQRGLSVTSNNITNATTTGYSRQVLGQNASIPLSGMGVGMLGTGVATTNITRIRESYLDTKLWSQNDKLGEYRIKVEQNSIIESVYGEPSDTGFTKIFNDLFNSIDNLSKLPDEKERQAAFRQQMINYTTYFNNMSASLSGFQRDLNFELKTKVDEINLLGSRIQSLNSQIYQAEIYGDDANTFRDARELAVDRLSQLVNVETKEVEIEIDGKKFKQFSVKIAGQTLVDHLHVRELGVTVRGAKEDQINELSAQLVKHTNEWKELQLLGTGTPAQINALQDKITDTLNKLQKLDPSITVTGEFDPSQPNYLVGYKIELGANTLIENDMQINLPRKKLNDEDIDSLYDVVWKDGLPFSMSDSKMSGELKGVIDMRDGCGTGSAVNYNGIPYYIKRMDQYVRQFAQTMNEEYSKDKDGFVELTNSLGTIIFKKTQANGAVEYFDANRLPIATPADVNTYQHKYQLFTYTDGNSAGTPEDKPDLTNGYKTMTAANFSISFDIFGGAGNIRTNYVHYPESDTNPNPSSNDLLLALSAQKNNKKMFKEGDPKDYMISMFSELGINTQEANMYEKTQTSITNNINNQRLAVSQVDTNEEFANLIKYQQAYQAAAKIINTIDGIYETTIFRLGSF
ncbi:flagellar hook-associated protein FlgK [Cellulosilyticum sp. I15G10I2]|uniref:flagellar hook-associated protein FlgK n=1 Tax=Cellulosilyticum sp. I15G10I2 TaxID=1892843 RepID=UPI00085C216E|nr:flagellar hook-associated protein FlgK [Cellulosilyticum sp. I15G10I2]